MSPTSVSLVAFGCAFGGALLGMFLQQVLPERHLSPESKDVVRLAMGLVATTVALVLGLLVASAKGFYDTQTTEVTQFSANMLLLDRLLAHYGPESADVRAEMQKTVASQIEVLWPRQDTDEGAHRPPALAGEAIIDKIQGLSPKDDRQRSLQSQALSLAIQLGQTRMLVYEQRQVPIPRLLLVILTFWLIALFASFGLFAPPNFTVLVSMFIAAAAVCGAVFLIIEMYNPYSGWIQISDAPLRAALAQLGR
jgi:hypothetical protein